MKWKARIDAFMMRHPKLVVSLCMAMLLGIGLAGLWATVDTLARLRLGLDGQIVSERLVGSKIVGCKVRISDATTTRTLLLDYDACWLLTPGLHVKKEPWSSELSIGQARVSAIPWLQFIAGTACGIAITAFGIILLVGMCRLPAAGAASRR